MTIDQTLKLAITKLKAKKFILPHLEAEILLSAVLKKPREFFIARPEQKLSRSQIFRFQRLISRRLKGEPIAYLLGYKEFYGLNFKVNKDVLIPRPETELMVDETLKLISSGTRPATIIDIGTGSGCIIISLIKGLNHESRIMNHEFLAADISVKALSQAKQNAKLHRVNKKIKFIKGDLLSPLIHNSSFIIHDSLIILANLPYGWKEWKNNCSLDSAGLKYEPAIALFTGKKGLELYEKLFKQIKKLVNSPNSAFNSSVFLFLEIDPRQAVLMKILAKKYFPHGKIQIKKDLASLDRLVIIQLDLDIN